LRYNDLRALSNAEPCQTPPSSPLAFTSQPIASQQASGRSSRRRGGGAAPAPAQSLLPAWTPAPATDAPAPEAAPQPAAAPHAAAQDAAEPACWCPSALWPFGPGSRLPEGVRQQLAAAMFAAAGPRSKSSSLRLACKGAAAYSSARARELTVVGESGARDLAAALRGGRFGSLRALHIAEPPAADASAPVAAARVVAELLGSWQLSGLEQLGISVHFRIQSIDVGALALSAARLRRLREITVTPRRVGGGGSGCAALERTSALEAPAPQASGTAFAVQCDDTSHHQMGAYVGFALALAAWPQMQVRGGHGAWNPAACLPYGAGKLCAIARWQAPRWAAGKRLCATWLSPRLRIRVQELHLRLRCYTMSESCSMGCMLLRQLAAAPLPRLARLVVSSNCLTDHAGLAQLSAAPWAPQLRSLELFCSDIVRTTRAPPEAHPPKLVFEGLQALTIHNGTLALFATAELPRLRSLVVSEGLSDDGVAGLFAGPPSWASSLQALDLSHCVPRPGPHVGAVLARAPLHALRSLRLRAREGPPTAVCPNDDTMQSLARAPWLSGLTELSFAGEALLCPAPAARAELAAAPLSSLRRLELRQCTSLGFGARAAAVLAAAPWLPSLELLDVTGASKEALSALRASAAFIELQRRRAAIF
jgi:hypothetical protein